MCDDIRRLWDLATSESLSIHERAVHAFTFDYFYVGQSNFREFATLLRAFVSQYPTPGRVDHLSAWADHFRKSPAEAIGLHGTSVSECLWSGDWDAETDEPRPYDMNTRTDHTEVFDWLGDASAHATSG